MANKPSELIWRTPAITWCVRLFFCAVIWWIGNYWLENGASALTGKMIFAAFIGISGMAIIASFIHSTFSLILVIVSVIIIPLAFFIGIGFVLQAAWWEFCVAFPVQMGIPVVVAWYMWKAPNVRGYYSRRQRV